VGHGECLLREPAIAELMIDTWRHFDGERYRLITWCVMPNHAHVILRLFRGSELARVVPSWKSYTAKVANRLLARSGEFWAREYYDHCIRDEKNCFGRCDMYCRIGEGGTCGLAVRWLRGLVARAPAGW